MRRFGSPSLSWFLLAAIGCASNPPPPATTTTSATTPTSTTTSTSTTTPTTTTTGVASVAAGSSDALDKDALLDLPPSQRRIARERGAIPVVSVEKAPVKIDPRDEVVAMSTLRKLSLGVIGALVAASPLLAHHDWLIDQTKPITITGTVTAFAWANPHVMIAVDVEANGAIEAWKVGGSSPQFMTACGCVRVRGTRPGDEVAWFSSQSVNAAWFSIIIGAPKRPTVPGTERIGNSQENDRCAGFGLPGVS